MARYCDIVMEGGITSGVVYPLAAVKLAETYEFKNVGGTSAGAIAAAGVAAAQYGKNHGKGTAFGELAKLPEWLGNKLTGLFQANPSTQPLFRIVIAATANTSPGWKFFGALSALLRGFPVAALVGLLPGAMLAGAVLAAGGPVLLSIGLLCAFALLVGGLALGLLAGLTIRAVKVLPPNGFGLVTGYVDPPDPDNPPLSTWLADLLDRLAGIEGEDALTFGDLWGDDPDDPRKINLEMMTTCLTQAQPYRLPFADDKFWFYPPQLERYFPPRIVSQMVRNARKDPRAEDFAPLVPLPEAADMPVVVATRMSLSFPLLISAVPLFAIDHSMAMEGEDRHPEPCWFSDGGIASNFPIHFFDSPVPRWPTFAIDLRKIGYGWTLSDKQRENVWMVRSNDSAGDIWWDGWDKKNRAGQLASFAGSIFRTMQTWLDTTQSHTQGYRDRIVHVEHTSKEGGMNLTMPKEVIDGLSERGKWAGELLRSRFSTPEGDGTPMNWDNQRWIRYRSFMRLLEGTLKGLRTGTTGALPPDPQIEELSRRGPETPPEFHWVSDRQRELALSGTADLIELIEAWQASGEELAAGAPEPAPELRVSPRI